MEKSNLHPRNRHRSRYDFAPLILCCPELEVFVSLNKYHLESIDFSNPEAVKTLNKALLKQFYGIANWDLPANYLCPPIPGRADYIHYMADLLSACNNGVLPRGKSIRILDIGIGANCIYPIIGNNEYGWYFVGSDIDPVAIKSANQIIAANDSLNEAIECRLQTSSTDVFRNIIKPGDVFDMSICNPPFHASLAEAKAGTERKWKNLGLKKTSKTTLNFGGQNSELWCEGGEEAMVQEMIQQSALFPTQCFWYSTLISKKSNLPGVYRALTKAKAMDIKTIDMAQGQKVSRIVTWTFLNESQQKAWRIKRWQF
ncbi:MAG: 23S rRNA (adenine(1618)-N(6))-methyltransferase RlmF [Legionellales bacterium]